MHIEEADFGAGKRRVLQWGGPGASCSCMPTQAGIPTLAFPLGWSHPTQAATCSLLVLVQGPVSGCGSSEVQGKLGFPSFLTGASGVAQEVSPWRIAALWIILPASCQPTGDGAAGGLCSKLARVEDPVNLGKCRPACAVTQAGPFSLGLSFPLCTACKGGGLSTGLA